MLEYINCFLFSVPARVLTANDSETKSNLLSIVSNVLYPIGLITPFTITAKMLFRNFGSEVNSGSTVWTMTLLISGGRGNRSFHS